jgi:hypothetical protein
MFVAAAVVTTGFAFGQEPQQPNEHLKGYGPFIGTWRYEGPLLEDVPGVAEKDSQFVFQLSWNWILDKQAVMNDWLIEFEGGEYSEKTLIGWHAAEEQVVYGGFSSAGYSWLGAATLDAKAKSISTASTGKNLEGGPTSFKGVIKKLDKDTLTWQALERTGGMVEGQSPVYTLKRVKGATRKTAANAGEVPEQMKGLGPFIGRWRYEGPLLEELPNFCKKGDPIVVRMSMRRILDKKVVMEDWLMEFPGGKTLSAKVLVGWNAADNKLALGIVNSVGAIALGSVELDPTTKTYSMATKGVNREGEETSYQSVLKKTGPDTLIWQRLGASGGLVDDEGPAYELKRVKRAAGKKAAK